MDSRIIWTLLTTNESMDKNKAIERLKAHAQKMDCGWRERAEWRRTNAFWIRKSQMIAVMMLEKMDEQKMTQSSLAEKLGCSQQYVSKLLKGQENMTLELLCKIESALGIQIFYTPSPLPYNLEEESVTRIVADASLASE